MKRKCVKDGPAPPDKSSMYPNISGEEVMRRLLDAGMACSEAHDAGLLWECPATKTCDCCEGSCDCQCSCDLDDHDDCDNVHYCECENCEHDNVEAADTCSDCGAAKP